MGDSIELLSLNEYVDAEGQPVLIEPDSRNEIEPEEREVGQVIARQGLVLKMGVDEAETAETRFAGAQPPELRKEDGACVSDDDVLDMTLSIDESANLTAGLVADLAEVARQLGRDDPRGWNLAAVDVLDPLGLTGLEALDISV